VREKERESDKETTNRQLIVMSLIFELDSNPSISFFFSYFESEIFFFALVNIKTKE